MLLARPKSQSLGLLSRSDEPIYLAVHFLGRSYICPGVTQCDLCKTESPRRVAYLAITLTPGGEILLFEMPAKTALEMQTAALHQGLPSLRNSVFALKRSTTIKAWSAELLSQAQTEWEPVSQGALLSAIERLYQFPPDPMNNEYDEDLDGWKKRWSTCMSRKIELAMKQGGK